jgi:hypothetical protein
MTTTAICQHRDCNKRFPLTPRAGRFTGRGRAPAERTYAPAKFCSDRCRVAANRARSSAVTASSRERVKSPPGTYTPSAVTAPDIPLTNQGAVGGKNTTLDPRIVPDTTWPGMYRIRLRDGSLSDMANLTRIKDAVRQTFRILT